MRRPSFQTAPPALFALLISAVKLASASPQVVAPPTLATPTFANVTTTINGETVLNVVPVASTSTQSTTELITSVVEQTTTGPGVVQPSGTIETIPTTGPTTLTVYVSTTTTDSAGSPTNSLVQETITYPVPEQVVASVIYSYTTPSASTTTSAAANSTKGLSSGAKAGVGVGVTIAALLAIVAALLFFRRRWKRKPREGTANDVYVKPELDGNAVLPPAELSTGEARELPDFGRYEMRGDEGAGELAGSHVKRDTIVHELGSP